MPANRPPMHVPSRQSSCCRVRIPRFEGSSRQGAKQASSQLAVTRATRPCTIVALFPGALQNHRRPMGGRRGVRRTRPGVLPHVRRTRPGVLPHVRRTRPGVLPRCRADTAGDVVHRPCRDRRITSALSIAELVHGLRRAGPVDRLRKFEVAANLAGRARPNRRYPRA